MSAIADWLRGLGLADHVDAFEREGIDLETVSELREEDLRELGLPMGPRKKLLRAISALNESVEPTPSPAEELVSVDAEAEHRQVTVLFSDISGFTGLSAEIGAEATHRLLAAYFAHADEIITSFGGTVDKHIGDSVMAIFGAPLAHGNDPERAVRAASAIQATMSKVSAEVRREVQVHIGLASGQVVASGVGGDSHYTVTGSSVNLASRLTDRAGPGEILISNSVHDALGAIAKVRDMGKLDLRGIAEPVRAWQLNEVAEVGTGRIDRAFVGRETELEQFRTVLEVCNDRRKGHVMFLRGEAGIGKTRLSEEVQRMADARGYASHRILILDFGAGKGQDPPSALTRSLLGLSSPSRKSDRAAAAEKAVADGLVSSEQVVFLIDFLDLPQTPEQLAFYDAIENSRRNQLKRETLAGLVRACSDKAPLLLLIEDVHWADALVIEYLAELARAIADRPVLMVITSRIEGDQISAAWRASISPTPIVTMDLRPLLPEEALKLASEFFDVAAQFAQTCVERADGNPLFLEQLLRGAEAAQERHVPGSVQSLVQARLDTLAPSDKRALQAASVLGQRFDLQALRHVVGDESYACKALIERHLVRPQAEMFLFAHALVREGVYASLLTEPRQALHRRAADWYCGQDTVLTAEHLDRAGDDRAAEAYLAASDAQRQTLNFNEAVRLAARGLEIATDIDTLTRLGCALAEARLSMGETLGAIESYYAALENVGNDDLKRKVLIGLAGALRLADRREEALEVLDQADAITPEIDDIADRVQVHYLRGSAYFTLGRLEDCTSEHQKGLELAQAHGLVEQEAQALSGLGDAHYLHGRMQTASESFKACIDLARAHGLTRIEVSNLYMVAWTLIHLNDEENALTFGIEAGTMGMRINQFRAAISGYNVQGVILHRQGQNEAALEKELTALELCKQTGYGQFETVSLIEAARVYLTMGDRQSAEQRAREALVLVRRNGPSFVGPQVLAIVAKITASAAERRELLDEAEALLDAGSTVSHNQLYFPEDIIPDELARSEWDAAERHALRLERYTASEPLPRASQIIEATKEIVAWVRGQRNSDRADRLRRIAADAEKAHLTEFASVVRSLDLLDVSDAADR